MKRITDLEQVIGGVTSEVVQTKLPTKSRAKPKQVKIQKKNKEMSIIISSSRNSTNRK